MVLTLTPDIINGTFELFGSVMLWFNFIQLKKDKHVKGISNWTVCFFTCWGLWNLFYYPNLGQWFSFAGGVSLAVANASWLVLMLYYKYYKGYT